MSNHFSQLNEGKVGGEEGGKRAQWSGDDVLDSAGRWRKRTNQEIARWAWGLTYADAARDLDPSSPPSSCSSSAEASCD